MGKKGGVVRCIYKDCQNYTGSPSNISFFRFPKDVKRCFQWVNACGQEKLKNLTSEELYNRYRICQEHFENTNFLNDLKNRLHSHACPRTYNTSLKLQIEDKNILSDFDNSNNHGMEEMSATIYRDNYETNISFPNQLNCLLDHDYTPFFVELCIRPNSNTDINSLSVENDPLNLNIQTGENLTSLENEISGDQRISTTVATQTDPSLSNNTPRKINLRKQINILRKKLKAFSSQKNAKSKEG